MLKLIPIFMFAAMNLSAVHVYHTKTPRGLSIEHHIVPNCRGAKIHHAPQDPKQYPGRGDRKQRQENRKNGRD